MPLDHSASAFSHIFSYLLQIARNPPLVEKEDKEPFPVADAIPQFIGFQRSFHGKIGLSCVPVKES